VARRMRWASPPESVAAAIEAEITETDREQEINALGDFLEGTRGDFFLAGGQLREDFVHRRTRRGERERSEVGNGPAGKFYGEGFGAEPLAVADAAESGGHVLRHPLAVGIRSGLFEIALEKFQDAGKSEAFFAFGFFRCCAIFTRSATAVGWRVAVEKHVLDARGEFVEGRFEIEAVRVGAELQRALENRGSGARAEAAIK